MKPADSIMEELETRPKFDFSGGKNWIKDGLSTTNPPTLLANVMMIENKVQGRVKTVKLLMV